MTRRSSPSARLRRSRSTRRTRTTTEGSAPELFRPLARPVSIAIGLGGNQGDPRSAFARALRRLAELGVAVERRSALYGTEPLGGPPQPDYVNAAVLARTRHAPLPLLTILKSLETEAGRAPRGPRNAPRPLDLDLLLYGDRIVETRELTVPHPRLGDRRFVLVPLADIWPHRVVPGLGRTVSRLLREAPPARVRLLGPMV